MSTSRLKRTASVVGFVLVSAIGATWAAWEATRFPIAATSMGRNDTPHVDAGSVLMHNGWVLNPVGEHVITEDMPSVVLTAPDGRYVIACTMGYFPNRAHAIEIPRIREFPGLSRGDGDQRAPAFARWSASLPDAWRGAAWGKGSHAETLFVSAGPKGKIYRLRYDPEGYGLQTLDALDPDAKSEEAFFGAIATRVEDGLLAIDEKNDVLLELDPATGIVRRQAKLDPDPFCLAVNPSGSRVYVADYGTGRVQVFGADLEPVGSWPVGKQPGALVVSEDGRWLICANTGADSVTVLDAGTGEVLASIRTSMSPDAPLGSCPNALAITPKGDRLYVANGNINNVAVVDLSEGPGEAQVLGFIPTGRYPCALSLDPQGEFLFIGVGKGFEPRPNHEWTQGGMGLRVNQLPGAAYGPNRDRNLVHDYVLSTQRGAVTRVAIPDQADLRQMTQLALQASPYRDRLLARAVGRPKDSVLPESHEDPSPFEHVVYIIKENRTYDQVFGGIPEGNGDPNLVLFPEDVAPNHHRLAKQFVLLDNTYCEGEVSQDGWEWSTAANDSDWNTRATLYRYGGRPVPPHSREEIRPSNRYLWEHAEDRGLTYYSYGAKTQGNLFSPTWKGNFSEPWNQARVDGTPDYQKAEIFLRDLERANETGKWPNLVLVSITDDHTSGTTPGRKTPYAYMASNDLALGRIVEGLTRSKFWEKMAIFVIEDDAQNGPDHVDAHRTVALVISPYTKRGSVDSTMYTTSGMVRSIELALGIPPMSQFDAAATPMFACFTGPKNLEPYRSVKPRTDMNATNPPNAVMADVSRSLDFSDVDLADFGTLNRILWAALKPNEPYPGVNSVFREVPIGRD